MIMDTTTDQDQHGSPAIRGGGDGRKRVIGEVDFFADLKSNYSDHHHHHHRHHMIKASHDHDKVEDHEQEAAPRDRQLDVNTGLCLLTTNTSSDKSTVDDGSSEIYVEDNKKPVVNKFAALQAEVDLMNSENNRLRGLLSQVSSNYHALTVQVAALMQRRNNQKSETPDQECNMGVNRLLEENKRRSGGSGARQFMDGPANNLEADHLDISRNCSRSSPQNEIIESMDFKTVSTASRKSGRSGKGLDHDQIGDDQDDHGQGSGSRWVPNKAARFSAGTSNSRDEEQTASEIFRKARVSVRARSEAAMISDGCQWRKYGQKMAKGNPCPRAYYRCTMATGCPVRKQLQRCAEDQTILTTTYEGSHNHPLPPNAMAMAHTTSAAATMLLSGSMPSADHQGLLNPNSFLARTGLPCSQIATLSASAPFPTITLDLTRAPNNSSSSVADQIMGQLRQIPLGDVNNVVSSSPLSQALGHGLVSQGSKFVGVQGLNISAGNPNELIAPEQLSAAMANPNFTAVLMAALTSLMGSNSNVKPSDNSCSVTTRSSNEKN